MVKDIKYKIILASASPRRQEFLSGLGINYKIKVLPDLDESFPDNLPAEEIPVYIAKKKAEAYKNEIQPEELIITADTIVWLNGEVLGKPENERAAKEMLHKISGNTHRVITGVCLTTSKWQKSFYVSTNVTFSKLTEEEISFYITQYHPFDKAGSYGVQEWIGYIAVERIEGSFYNVMGLPIQRLYKELMCLP